MNIGYIRITVFDENKNSQIHKLQTHNINKWVVDDPSGTELHKLFDQIKKGDFIFITDLNKIAKTLSDLQETIERLKNIGAYLVSIKENIDSSKENGVSMLSMAWFIPEFEKISFLEKQKEGIEYAKQIGKYHGRQPIKVDVNAFDKLYEDFLSKKITKIVFAENIGVTRPTLDKFIKAYETNSISECDGYYFVETIKTVEGKTK